MRKKKKNVTRISRGRKKGSKNYFTKDTENAIIEYNKSFDSIEKNKIYKNKIEYAFDKLVENTINNNNFPYILEQFSDIKHEVIIHLIDSLHKYVPTEGKAFSYFGTIAKRYLIAWNTKNYALSKIHDSIDIIDYNRNIGSEVSLEESKENAFYVSELLIEYFENNIDTLFKKQKDRDVVYAVITLLRHRMTLENYNKKAIYIYLREITRLKTHNITKVLNKLKIIYKKLLKEYYKKGTIDTRTQIFV